MLNNSVLEFLLAQIAIYCTLYVRFVDNWGSRIRKTHKEIFETTVEAGWKKYEKYATKRIRREWDSCMKKLKYYYLMWDISHRLPIIIIVIIVLIATTFYVFSIDIDSMRYGIRIQKIIVSGNLLWLLLSTYFIFLIMKSTEKISRKLGEIVAECEELSQNFITEKDKEINKGLTLTSLII